MTSKEYQKFVLTLKKGGASFDEAKSWMAVMASSNGMSFDELLPQIVQIYQAKANAPMTERLRDMVLATDGQFTVRTCYESVEAVSVQAKAAVRQALHELVKGGVIEKSTEKDGVYRKYKNELEVIDWKNADASAIVDVKLPLGIHNWVNLYPKNIVMVAGATSAGKSAFVYNTIGLNQDSGMPIVLLNSETGPEEMRRRMVRADPQLKWKFGAFYRSCDFADVVVPNGINIIDYMEVVDGKAYMIADEIRKITDRLDKGIAIVCIQKKFGAEMGYGAETSMWKSRLYLTMEYHKDLKEGSLTILKATNPKIEGLLPRFWKWTYKMNYGFEFEILSEPDELMEHMTADAY
jgi:hypothetical protein